MQPGDWVLFGFAATATIPFVFANAVIFLYRRRRFFKAHGGVELILGGSIAGLVWIAANFVTNGHLEHRHGFMNICPLWTFWLKMSFGLNLWLICITMRLHRMDLLIRDESCKYHCLWIPIFMLPTVIFSSLATLMHAFHWWVGCNNLTNLNIIGCLCCVRKEGACSLKLQWRYCSFFIISPLYFSGVLIFLLRLRKQKDVVLRREFIHTCDYCIMAFLIYILSGVVYLTDGQEHVAGRCFLTFCFCCLVFFHFWVRMAWPVYLCLFKPESEMDRYEEELKQSGASIFEVIAAVNGRYGYFNMSSSVQAYLEAKEQVETLKTQFQKLEMQKSDLEYKVHLLQQLRTAASQSEQVTAIELQQ